MRRIASALATLVVLLLIAAAPACGGGDDKGPPLSDEAFLEQANAACVAGDAELEKAGEDLVSSGQPKTEEIANFFLDEAVPIARRKLDQIEDLSPPANKAEVVEEMLAAGREAIDEVSEGLEEDPGGYLTEKGPDPFDDFDEMARELGLDKCASVAQPLPGEGDPATTTTTAATTPETTATSTPPSS
ncbi:MAG: hypothetical protein ACRDZ3_13655 [Acidimicrobiia bacterium]